MVNRDLFGGHLLMCLTDVRHLIPDLELYFQLSNFIAILKLLILIIKNISNYQHSKSLK